jgi:hypothetical protein
MPKRSSGLNLDELRPAELEEHLFVLRTLVSRTFAKETDMGLGRSRRADFDTPRRPLLRLRFRTNQVK